MKSSIAQDGDAIYNKLIKEYTLYEDGNTEYREYKEIKLLSHMSFHRLFGETFIVFDPEYQEIVIHEAYTIMRDGKKVIVPDNAFNEVLPRAASHASPYNRLRELVITHTGLEVGATIYLDYSIISKAGFMSTFMGEEAIMEVVPVKEKKVIISIPADQDLKYRMLNLRTAPELSENDGMKAYTFVFAGLSEYSREWGVDQELLPRLFFSNAKDLERAYFPFVAQEAFTWPVNNEMEDAVKKIRDEEIDDLAVALAIQDMVVNDIATWNIPLVYIGYKCRTPVEVWNSNGGTPLEKAVLLATLLQKARLSGVPVAIIPQKYFDRNVGSLYIFKDFAVMAKVGMGERLYFSPTHISSQNLAYEETGNLFLVLDGAIESLRTNESISEVSQIIYNGVFTNRENEKVTGELNIQLRGAVNPYFKLSQDTAYAKRYFGGTQDVDLISLKQEECVFNLGVEKKDVFKIYGDYIFMDIPESFSGVSSWGFSYIEKGRTAPIKLKEFTDEQYHYVLELPGGYTLVSPSVDINIENGIGKLKISLRQEENIILIDRELILEKVLINYNEFDSFSKLWNAWMNPSMKEIIFKKD